MFHPMVLSPFCGRPRELAHLGERLRAGARLITVVGAGGSGKTRLARQWQVGAEMRSWFVDLTDAADESAVLNRIGEALNLPFAAGTLGELGEALVTCGAMVLVLDNCEQIVELVASLVGALLEAAPEMQILATSRERLRRSDEEAFELGPLDDDAAVALFAQGTQQLQHDFDAQANLAKVIEVVRVLDGLPLAIELAAARMGLMSLGALHDRLQSSLDALGAGPRNVHARQRTMRATIEWSWGLLSPEERTTLRRLSVFRGGFDAAAAEAVCDAGSTLEHLAALRDKSLIRVLDVFDTSPRLGLYVSIHQFAEEQLLLDAVEASAVRQRHADHFAARARRLLDAEVGAIAGDAENFREVLARASSSDDKALWNAAAEIVPTLEALVLSRESVARWQRRLEALIAQPASADSPHRARVLLARARARRLAGANVAAARRDVEEALRLGEAMANVSIIARACREIAKLAHENTGDLETGRRDLERALTILPRGSVETAELETQILGTLANGLRDLGLLEEARARYEEALLTARSAGLGSLEGKYLSQLGVLLLQLGDHVAATRVFDQALTILEELDDRRAVSLLIAYKTMLLVDSGDLDGASTMVETSLALAETVGERRLRGFSLCLSGRIHLEAGRLDEAERAYREGLIVFRGSSAIEHGLQLLGLASVLAVGNRHTEAEALFVDAEQILERIGAERDRIVARTLRGLLRSETAPALVANALPYAARSKDVRHALRLLDKTWNHASILEVDREAMAFRVAGGILVDLSRRAAPRRILAGLTHARMATPGRALPTHELFELGWPGEKPSVMAAQNRVWVAVASLRSLGLRTLLRSSGDGYFLDEATPITVGSLRV